MDYIGGLADDLALSASVPHPSLREGWGTPQPPADRSSEGPSELIRCRHMDAEIISVGTELTCGLTVDTNAAWLSQRLAAIGVIVARHVTVPDDGGVTAEAIRDACARSGLVLINGGLGPTPDDLTRGALADALGKPLIKHAESLRHMRSMFERRRRPMPPSNERQAWLPKGAQALDNTCGTAPGIRAKSGSSLIFAMPGVPKEMQTMFKRSIEPELRALGRGAVVTRTVNCFGASEARIAAQIEDLMAIGREPTVGITASEGVIRVRVFARGANVEAARAAAQVDAAEVRRRFGSLVFGEDDQTLQQAVAALLLKAGRTLAVAESCTGGLLDKHLTDVPGSSNYFLGGFVTYANEAKIAQLGIASELIDRHGAVSEEVARTLAVGCRDRTGADYALAVTGIAGPGGGTADKPVGLVYIALADAGGCDVTRELMGEHLDRASIRDRTCKVALNLLRIRLMETEAEAPRP